MKLREKLNYFASKINPALAKKLTLSDIASYAGMAGLALSPALPSAAQAADNVFFGSAEKDRPATVAQVTEGVWQGAGSSAEGKQKNSAKVTTVNGMEIPMSELYRTILDNEVALINAGFDIEPEGQNLRVYLRPATGHEFSQNRLRWKTNQLIDAFNGLGYHRLEDEVLNPWLQAKVEQFVETNRRIDIDPSKVSYKRDHSGQLVDILYVPTQGVTGVREGHVTIQRDEFIELTPSDLQKVAPYIVDKVIVKGGDVYVGPKGDCRPIGGCVTSVGPEGVTCGPCGKNGNGSKDQNGKDSNGTEPVCVGPDCVIYTKNGEHNGDDKNGKDNVDKNGKDNVDKNGSKDQNGKDSNGTEPVCTGPDCADKDSNGKDKNGSKDRKGSRIILAGQEALDAYAALNHKDMNWKMGVETPDANGVPIKSEETAHNTNLGAMMAIVYRINPNLGIGAMVEANSFGGKEEGDASKARLDLILSSQYGWLVLGYVPQGTENWSRNDNDGNLKLSRTNNFTGFEARYVSPNLWNKEGRAAFIMLDYDSLTGKSESKVEFDVPGLIIPDRETEGDYSRTSLDIGAKVLFLPTPVGALGLEASYGQSQTRVEDGEWKEISYGIGPSMAIPVKLLGKDAVVDLGVRYLWATQELPDDESVTDSTSEGLYLNVGLRPADKGPLY